MEFSNILKNNFNNFQIKYNENIIQNFSEYYYLLKYWNEKINLTSIIEENEVAVKHFIDSISAEKYININSKILDIGAGAGFPSLPLKIYRNDLDITMIDSLNKRVNFLNEVISKLKLTNIRAEHFRAEDFAKTHFQEYDYVVARAVANLTTLAEYCLPFVKIGGCFIAYKGNAEAEVNDAAKAINILGGKVEKVFEYNLGDFAEKRALILVKKVKNTPNVYPRSKNLPKTKPLS